MARILVVEDDPSIQELVGLALEEAGHAVTLVADGDEAIRQFLRSRPDLVLLDLKLPHRSGFEVCRRIRATARTPILMMTSLAEEEDQIAGLQLGADDYVTKPFSVRVLTARVEALLRRGGAAPERSERIQVGDLEIDLATGQVWRGGVPVALTPTEFRVLAQLAAAAGRVLGARELLWRAQGYDADEQEAQRILKVHISHLRNKIERDPQQPAYILSVRGFGYMFRPGTLTGT